jgi:hypothetical protein
MFFSWNYPQTALAVPEFVTGRLSRESLRRVSGEIDLGRGDALVAELPPFFR